MDINETAAYLGISRATVYRLIRRGAIRTYRLLSHTVRIRKSDLDQFINGTLETGDSSSTISGAKGAP
jgi:excisionase family DNA binding protein